MLADQAAPFPIGAGILFGLSLGAFSDADVLHQMLRWQQMLTSADPAGGIDNLHPNLIWEGILQLASYVFVGAGAFALWRAAQRRRTCWSARLLAATILIGFGAFNLVEGAVAHLLLGLHHANETVARDAWLGWDLGCIACGALMLVGGWVLYRSGRADEARQAPPAETTARPAVGQRR